MITLELGLEYLATLVNTNSLRIRRNCRTEYSWSFIPVYIYDNNEYIHLII